MKLFCPITGFSRNKIRIILLIAISLTFNFCNDEPSLWDVKSNEQIASDFIAGNPDYSEFTKLIELTGLESILRLRGPYTVFIPENESMFSYYELKNKKSLDEFNEKELANLVRNHIIANSISTGDIGLGAIRDTNALGDFLITEFHTVN